jgi:Maltose operon periplasmic protein precursor (MalM)
MNPFRMTLFQAGVIASLLSLLLGGCRAPGPRGIELAELQRTNATVVSGYQEILAAPLTFDESGRAFAFIDHIALGPTSAFRTPSGDNQVVKLFKLPGWTSPYEIQVASFAAGGLQEPTLYYPKVTFLDSTFKSIRESKPADFVFRNIGSQGGISTTFFVNESNQKEIYLAVVTESRSAFEEQLSILQTSSSSSFAVPVKGGAFFFSFTSSGNEPPKKMRASETGYLELKLTRPKVK